MCAATAPSTAFVHQRSSQPILSNALLPNTTVGNYVRAEVLRIRFVRRESADRAALMSVPADGGAPERMRSINTDWERIQEIAWTETRIAWMSGSPYGGDGEVLVADLADGEPRRLLDGEYRGLSFSSDGEFLLADQHGPDGSPAVGKARVVPVHGGKAVAVASGRVTYPTWASEGHAIAYVPGGTHHHRVADEAIRV